MVQALEQATYITPEEYLKGEPLADIKSEYVNGEIEAMAGASDQHVTISGSAFALLKAHLRGSGCRTRADKDGVVNLPVTVSYPA